jgi:hypothetical protein
MTKAVCVISLAVIMAMEGCSTKIDVKDISAPRVCKEESKTPPCLTSGIPFRTIEPYRLRLYQKTADGFKEIGEPLDAELPSVISLQAINFEAGYFSNNTFKLTLDPNGSITQIDTTEAMQLDKALAAFTKSATGVAGAAIDYDLAQEKRKGEVMEAEVKVLEQRKKLLDAQRAYDKALQD